MMLYWGNASTGPMAEPKKSTFAYAASTDHPDSVNQAAPSFPPTSLMFQTYAFISPGASAPEVGLEKGQKNMLLYLNMTRHKPFPIERYLNYSGNHVPSTIDGSITIEKDVFWNSYLIRPDFPLLLNVLNKVTYAWVQSVTVDYGGVSASWTAKYGVGPTGKEPMDFFQWKPVDDLNWKWSRDEHKKDDNGWEGVFGAEIDMWCESSSLWTIWTQCWARNC